ncbi:MULTISPECIES: DUF362 domain-containing protein [unclassified Fusibacter]|uniref:DUF362 domain-containing protein n=1 Tax=unclassified Fusibacter TaxID=2624464 RepID=UPI0010123D01|nr:MULTISPECIES: DUF362 domain-containing protein [unclassified Fusibacter]MCK8060024.1 DUF362 domain-containing protein [Fusibacter sp. A2]NPE22164.1 DUF362 domain-containing protein [Fusibacter sp. A1]RXV60941.1 DUF362 domain-containing protein [Fusibacter sp. A1]
MNTVYMKRITDPSPESLSRMAGELLAHLCKEKAIEFKGHIPIKVHFGEKGNKTFVPAVSYNGVIDYLKQNGNEVSFIETNVLYRGHRTTKDNHLALAKEHGFTQVPIIIADGDRGEAYSEIAIDKEYFSTCKIGSAFDEFNQMVVCSHFKGHGMAGFGGAVKQLAMGFASRGGKMAQHAKMVPTVSSKNCVSCGLCIEKCDVNAIAMPDKAVIDDTKCVGCAGCIAVCPVGAIRNDWSADNFKAKVAEYAYAAQLGKEFVYITYAMNITAECDCMGSEMEPIASDIGVFASTDAVAIDQACYDMLRENHGHALFEDGLMQLEHGEKIGLGSREYELIGL